MLETITGSATMTYIPEASKVTGWYVAGFIGALWILTLFLLEVRIRQIRVLKHCNKILENRKVKLQ